ncbi:MAG: alpha/beta fold hydrolase [Pseudomonadota bacterium]
MATFLLAHGAWNGGWAWRKLRPLMQAAGHDFWTPTYTGLGERAHLAHRGIDLDTHIADIMGVIEAEELQDIVLVGHSYGGMVATAVADRARDRVQRLIYVDAFAPRDGDSVASLLPMMDIPDPEAGPDWLVDPAPLSPDFPDADVAWSLRHRMPHPAGCFRQPVRLQAEPSCPRHYIYALHCGPVDRFGPFRDRARTEPGWTLTEMDCTHSPNITAPQQLFDLLDGFAD